MRPGLPTHASNGMPVLFSMLVVSSVASERGGGGAEGLFIDDTLPFTIYGWQHGLSNG